MRALRMITFALAMALIVGELWRSWGVRPLGAIVDDLIAGSAMVLASWAVRKETLRTRAAFSGVWGLVAGGLFGSFLSKALAPERVDAGNWNSTALVWMIGAAFVVSMICLGFSIILPPSAQD